MQIQNVRVHDPGQVTTQGALAGLFGKIGTFVKTEVQQRQCLQLVYPVSASLQHTSIPSMTATRICLGDETCAGSRQHAPMTYEFACTTLAYVCDHALNRQEPNRQPAAQSNNLSRWETMSMHPTHHSALQFSQRSALYFVRDESSVRPSTVPLHTPAKQVVLKKQQADTGSNSAQPPVSSQQLLPPRGARV